MVMDYMDSKKGNLLVSLQTAHFDLAARDLLYAPSSMGLSLTGSAETHRCLLHLTCSYEIINVQIHYF